VDYRPKTNTEMLLDMGHTLRGDCVHCINEYNNFKLAGATIGRGLESSGEDW
jgi:hypothetical protein